ncbi:MAG: pyruvate kinase, partial [Gammaproteobacteria bacterium]
PEDAIDKLEIGDFISLDFNSVLVQVVEHTRERVAMRVIQGGRIGQNKAVTVERDIELDTLTAKDRAALAYAREAGIRHVALSFANRGADVDLVRSLSLRDLYLISKIECRNALQHLDEIALKSDALLIDRGDLSRQEPIERIPRLQKAIIARGRALGRKVYVATNLLESMVTSPKPTRAEVNDVINTLFDGADGLVMAAETAIGQDPIGCVAMVRKLVDEFRALRALKDERRLVFGDEFAAPAGSLLVPPHGGALVQRVATAPVDLDGLRRVPVRTQALLDCQQIATGTYSPLTGFMDEATLASVLDHHRLPDGLAWSLPIVLSLPADAVRALAPGERVVLTDAGGVEHAWVDVTAVYRPDLEAVARSWFGTADRRHPGVASLLAGGTAFVAGPVTLLRRVHSPFRDYELTPAQTRFIFSHKGWSKVVGFHTRNVAHRAHEFVQLETLRRTHADGLYINPVTGPARAGDFVPALVMQSYQKMIDFGVYPEGKVLLGSFASYPRYAGPREAVFTALCRKNMGCSHFVIGRNRAGVGDWYEGADYRRLFDRLGDPGITPVFFDAVGFNAATQAYEQIPDGAPAAPDVVAISGTAVRAALARGEALPTWYMRDLVQELLFDASRNGLAVFRQEEAA